MKVSKGFTLIELLAVILILGIIALIAIPVVTKIIDQVKMNSLKETTNNMVSSASDACSTASLRNLPGAESYIVAGGSLNKDLKLKGKLPDNGSLAVDSDCKVTGYMYRDKYCAYTVSDKVKVEKATYEECLTKNDFPKLISNVVKVGDYVSYDAGKWNNSIATTAIEADSFGGYGSGNSKNSGLDCASSGSIVINNSGWRVSDINSSSKVVQLVHAGTPECYNKTTWGSIPTSTEVLFNRSYSMYLNKEYATSASILTKEQAEKVQGSTIAVGDGFYDEYNNVLKAGGLYYFPNAPLTNANHLVYVQPGGYVSSMGSGLAGIRPVVNLKNSVYVTGGTGTKNDPYIIKNYGTDTYKDARFTGYWFNWNNENADPALDTATNLKLKDVPTYYDYVNVAFGITATGSENGTIDFSVDEYLASHLGGYTKEEFISDVNTLKQRGQKVILSIGGASASITLDSDADVNRFIDSTEALINEYGFDGIDIDIENTINTANLEKAIKGVLDKHDDDFILTFAIETVDFQVNANAKAQGRYLDMILNLKNDINLVNIQVYNTGSQYGIDRKDYTPGTLDFAVAIPTILLEKGLREDQVGLGINSNSTKTGYIVPSMVVSTYTALKTGVCSGCSTFILPTSYKHFGGVMLWGINEDVYQDEQFGSVIKDIVN